MSVRMSLYLEADELCLLFYHLCYQQQQHAKAATNRNNRLSAKVPPPPSPSPKPVPQPASVNLITLLSTLQCLYCNCLRITAPLSPSDYPDTHLLLSLPLLLLLIVCLLSFFSALVFWLLCGNNSSSLKKSLSLYRALVQAELSEPAVCCTAAPPCPFVAV